MNPSLLIFSRFFSQYHTQYGFRHFPTRTAAIDNENPQIEIMSSWTKENKLDSSLNSHQQNPKSTSPLEMLQKAGQCLGDYLVDNKIQNCNILEVGAGNN